MIAIRYYFFIIFYELGGSYDLLVKLHIFFFFQILFAPFTFISFVHVQIKCTNLSISTKFSNVYQGFLKTKLNENHYQIKIESC